MFSPALRAPVLGVTFALFSLCAGAGDDKKIDLQVGDKAPAFDLRTDADKTWGTADHYGKKWVVTH